jgi:hypothetical protein
MLKFNREVEAKVAFQKMKVFLKCLILVKEMNSSSEKVGEQR